VIAANVAAAAAAAVDENGSASLSLNKDELKSEIKAMLWPYYLNQGFVSENAKSLPPALSKALCGKQPPVTIDDFVDTIVSHLYNASGAGGAEESATATTTTTTAPIRINLMGYLNQTTSEILAKISSRSGVKDACCSEYLENASAVLPKSETVIEMASVASGFNGKAFSQPFVSTGKTDLIDGVHGTTTGNRCASSDISCDHRMSSSQTVASTEPVINNSPTTKSRDMKQCQAQLSINSCTTNVMHLFIA
jgi:hypothetical protein